jgi:hypothetical protein
MDGAHAFQTFERFCFADHWISIASLPLQGERRRPQLSRACVLHKESSLKCVGQSSGSVHCTLPAGHCYVYQIKIGPCSLQSSWLLVAGQWYKDQAIYKESIGECHMASGHYL